MKKIARKKLSLGAETVRSLDLKTGRVVGGAANTLSKDPTCMMTCYCTPGDSECRYWTDYCR